MRADERKLQRGGGWGGDYYAAESWDEFDSLPWELRRLYCFCAYKYTALPAYEMYAAGRSLDGIIRLTVARMKRAVRREALRLYGPTHPQAGAA